MNMIKSSAEKVINARLDYDNNELRIIDAINKSRDVKDKFKQHSDSINEIESLLSKSAMAIAYNELSTEEFRDLKTKREAIEAENILLKDEMLLYDDAVNLLISKRGDIRKQINNEFMRFLDDVISDALSNIDFSHIKLLFYCAFFKTKTSIVLSPREAICLNLGELLLKRVSDDGFLMNNDEASKILNSKILELTS